MTHFTTEHRAQNHMSQIFALFITTDYHLIAYVLLLVFLVLFDVFSTPVA